MFFLSVALSIMNIILRAFIVNFYLPKVLASSALESAVLNVRGLCQIKPNWISRIYDSPTKLCNTDFKFRYEIK